MAAHSPFRNASVEFALWALWRAASGVQAALRPVVRVVARAVREIRAACQRALIRVELALADVLTDGAGRLRDRAPYIALGMLAIGNVGWLVLQ